MNPVLYLFYAFVWSLMLPILVLLSYTFVPKWRAGLKQKLGFYQKTISKNSLWFHAVSVGEFNALYPLLRTILDESLGSRVLVLSTSTSTAQNLAATKLRAEIEAGLIELIYLPWDHPWIVQKTLRLFRPKALVLVETEIWPSLILEARRLGIKVALINARLNDSSYRLYKFFDRFFRPIFASFDLVLSQSPSDTQKFLDLGVSGQCISSLANIKFAASPLLTRSEAQALRLKLGYPKDIFILLAASTHEEEEVVLINIFQELKIRFPHLRLVLAPRHPDRFAVVEQLILSAAQLQVLHFSSGTKVQEISLNQVLLIDSIGDLSTLMSIADLVFVGGTINPKVGGHNVLEPASYGLPVLIGAHYFKNIETVEMMEAEGALEVIESVEELRLAVTSLIQDEDRRVLMGARALNAMKKHREVLATTLSKLKGLIS